MGGKYCIAWSIDKSTMSSQTANPNNLRRILVETTGVEEVKEENLSGSQRMNW